MADQFAPASFTYPQGSFYEDLDARLRNLEDIVGTAEGMVNDFAVTENKLADLAVTTRAIRDANVTGAKLSPNAIATSTLNAPEAVAMDDDDYWPLADSSSGNVLNKISLASFVTSLFKPARTIKNGIFDLASYGWVSSGGYSVTWNSDAVTTDITINLPNHPIDLALFPYQRFRSAQTAYAANGLLTLPHGLPAAPDPYRLRAFMVCVTTDLGYPVGSVVQLSTTGDYNGTATAGYGINLYADATNVYAKIGVTNVAYLVRRDTGVVAAPTIANWRIVVECEV